MLNTESLKNSFILTAEFADKASAQHGMQTLQRGAATDIRLRYFLSSAIDRQDELRDRTDQVQLTLQMTEGVATGGVIGVVLGVALATMSIALNNPLTIALAKLSPDPLAEAMIGAGFGAITGGVFGACLWWLAAKTSALDKALSAPIEVAVPVQLDSYQQWGKVRGSSHLI